MKLIKTTPKYDLKTYRDFIRDAAAYVTLILGRRVKPEDADRFSDEELTKIALKIDERVTDLHQRPDKPN